MKFLDEDRIRYERKFAVANQRRTEVEQQMKLHPALFREIFYRRAINNIYFDTTNARHLRDSVEGATNRLKIRIRWYGDLFGKVKQPMLEFKWKQGVMVSKDSFPVEPFEISRGMNFVDAFSLKHIARVPRELQSEICNVRPVLVNRYRRSYFLCAARRYRVTVDDRLSYFQVRHNRSPFLSRAIDDQHVIVELKYARADDLDADRISGELPFRMSRWSKFVAGLDRRYEG